MKRTEPIAVGEMLDSFFKERQLRSAVNEGRAVEIWAEIVGEYVANYTEDVYIRAGILYVTFSSAAVRSEIHIRRRYYVTKLNEKLGAKVVRNIVIR